MSTSKSSNVNKSRLVRGLNGIQYKIFYHIFDLHMLVFSNIMIHRAIVISSRISEQNAYGSIGDQSLNEMTVFSERTPTGPV